MLRLDPGSLGALLFLGVVALLVVALGLRSRLWDGFARLQVLLGRHAMHGAVIERPGIVGSVVPAAPDSPTLNAAVVLDPEQALEHLHHIVERWEQARVRRWGVWVDGSATETTEALDHQGLSLTASSPGMGAALHDLPLPDLDGQVPRADLATVGRVNDLAYGNPDQRLERTLTPLPRGVLRGFKVEHHHKPAAVALVLHHGEDCGVSFVATAPHARRKGLASLVMHGALRDARDHGATSTTLQATEVGLRLYDSLGLRKLCDMQLWERRR
jgi:GNAT superfamily N-acetyltransferase